METHTYRMPFHIESGVPLGPQRRQNRGNLPVFLCERTLPQLFSKRMELCSKAEYMCTSSCRLSVVPPIHMLGSLTPQLMLFGGGALRVGTYI